MSGHVCVLGEGEYWSQAMSPELAGHVMMMMMMMTMVVVAMMTLQTTVYLPGIVFS